MPTWQLFGALLGKNPLDDSSNPLNILFQDDSRDLADESDDFFHFMGWNDSSEQEEERKQSFSEDDVGKFYLYFRPSCSF